LPKARKEPRISCRSAAIRYHDNHVPTLDSHHAAGYTVRFILTGTERPVCPRALGPILPQSHLDSRSTFFPRLPKEHKPPGISHQDQTPAPSSAPHSKTLTSPSPFLPVAPSRRRHRTRPIGQIQRQTSRRCANSSSTRHDTIRRATPSACTHTRPHILPQLARQAVPRAQWFTFQRSTRVRLKSPHTVGPVCRLGSTGFDSDNGCALRSAHLGSSSSRCTYIRMLPDRLHNRSANRFASR
jgi:hypothetical protein